MAVEVVQLSQVWVRVLMYYILLYTMTESLTLGRAKRATAGNR